MLARIPITALLFAAFALNSCTDTEEIPSEAKVRPAKLVTVVAATNQRELTFPAVIRAADYAELTFQISGEIRELNVLEGSEINEGDVIASLDQRNAQNALAQAEVEYRNAEAELTRAERLISQDAIAQSTLDARRAQRDVAKVSLSNAQKALSDTVLRAPFTGSISRVFARQFQNIQAKEAIAVIQSDEVEAIVNIPGTIVARIPQLEPVSTTVVLDAAPGTEIPGEFIEASGVADENTQTYEIKFTFAPPEDVLILPGMTAAVSTVFAFSDSARDIVAEGVAVPLSSILAEGEDRFVWVVDGISMTISKRRVVVASDGGEQVTVIEGLADGETIVAAGVSFFHEGMQVRPWIPE